METGSETCPFVMLEIYMQKGAICKDREAHIFCPMYYQSDRLSSSGCLSYRRIRSSLLKGKLEELRLTWCSQPQSRYVIAAY